MPGHEIVTHGGFQFEVSSAYWLRRWTRFPFFFDSFNPSFRVSIKRVSEEIDEQWVEQGKFEFIIRFADDASAPYLIPVPTIEVGESVSEPIGPIFTSFPGQTSIVLVMSRNKRTGTYDYKPLYSYRVREEESIWIWLVGPSVGALLALVGQKIIQMII